MIDFFSPGPGVWSFRPRRSLKLRQSQHFHDSMDFFSTSNPAVEMGTAGMAGRNGRPQPQCKAFNAWIATLLSFSIIVGMNIGSIAL